MQDMAGVTKPLTMAVTELSEDMPAPEEAELIETAQRLLQNKEQANGIYDRLAERKLTDYFKSAVSMTKKEMKYDDFVAQAQA